MLQSWRITGHKVPFRTRHKVSANRPSHRRMPAVHSTPWADVDPSEKPVFSFIPSWEEEEGDDQKTTGVRLFKTSKKTEAFFKQSFTSAAPNQQRRQWGEKIGAPNTPFTACPSMDKLMKSRLLASAKTWDRTLAKHQALMLDAVGPITHILEGAAKGQLILRLLWRQHRLPLNCLATPRCR